MLHILIGKPGTGKGTQAHMLSGRMGYKHVSMGNLLRTAAQGDKELKKLLDAGELAPEGICHHILKDTLKDIVFDNTPIILDGFPRSIRQAEQLNSNLIGSIISLQVDDDEILKERLRGRKRGDDKEEVISRRLEVFDEATRPLMEYYSEELGLIEIDASRSAELIYLDMVSEIRKNNR